MSVTGNQVVNRQNFAFTSQAGACNLPQEDNTQATKSAVVYHCVKDGACIDHLHVLWDSNAIKAGATIEFVKLTAAQTVAAYVAAPSSSTGTSITVNASGTATPIAIDSGKNTNTVVDLTLVTQDKRTMAAGDRIVAILTGLNLGPITGSGTGTGEVVNVVGFKGASAGYMVREWKI